MKFKGASSGYLGAKATLVKPNSAAATSEPVKKPAAEKVISKTNLGNTEVTVSQIFENFGEEFAFLEGTQVHQTAKQRAYDLINKCLQKLNKNPNMAKNMLLGKVFQDLLSNSSCKKLLKVQLHRLYKEIQVVPSNQ